MHALGVVAAACQQELDQGVAVRRKGCGAELVAGLVQPMEHRHRTGGGIEAHTIGEAAVAGWVVRQHQGEATLSGGGLPEFTPASDQLGHPGQSFQVWLVAGKSCRQPRVGLG